MSPLVSIVIPVYREPIEIGRCLAYLATCRRMDACEIIVVEGDGGRSMPAHDVLPIRVVRSSPGRGRQLNAGATVARGDTLLFLHVDTRPPRGFVSAIGRALVTRDAGAFDLHVETVHPFVRVVSLVGLVRSRITRIPYGDQAQFIRRDVFTAVGGFPDVPIMEDVILMDRMKQAGTRIALLRPPARTSDRRWIHEGPVKAFLRNQRIMLAFRHGVAPAQLHRRYRPQHEIEDATDYLIVFHRALREKGVKTRLARDVGTASALALYRAMLDDVIRCTALRPVRTEFFIDDPAAGLDYPGRSVAQSGPTLWSRMDDAIRRCIAAGGRRVVIIGSDIPALSAALLRSAFRSLARCPFVVGPSADGGFYLLGCLADRYDSGVLAAASASGGRSADAIARWASDRGMEAERLPTHRDVDTLADLREVLADPTLPAVSLRSAARRVLAANT